MQRVACLLTIILGLAVGLSTRVIVRLTVFVEPAQQLADASARERDAGIGGAVIEIDAVSIGVERVPTGKRHIADISLAFVAGFGTEEPAVTSQQTMRRPVQSEASEAES